MIPFKKFLTRAYHSVLTGSAIILGAKRTRILEARWRYGRKLNFDSPSTLADKVSWLEFNTDQTFAARCTDKFEVRGYLKERGLSEILIPLIGGPWSSTEQIDFSSLPNEYIMKATHGCDMNLVQTRTGTLKSNDVKKTVGRWLKSNYGRSRLEPHYLQIPRRIYSEELLTGLEDVIDYKFHCINGRVEFILTCSQRKSRTGMKLNLFDRDWLPLLGLQGVKENKESLPPPPSLNWMIEVCEQLSKDVEFVRVDLYNYAGKVLFGEMTFSPAAGVFPNFTDDFIEQQGAKLVLPGGDLGESASTK